MIEQQPDQLHLHGIDPLQGKNLIVRKRDGRHEEFNEARICLAIESAFRAVEGLGRDAILPEPLPSAIRQCADVVVERVLSRAVRGEQMEVERIQDAVEDQLMLDGHLAVARCYILYREKRRLARAEREGRIVAPSSVPPAPIPAPQPKAAAPAPQRPAPGLLERIYSQALPKPAPGQDRDTLHRVHFSRYLNEGHYLNQLAPALLDFDLDKLAAALRLERDAQFPPAGLQNLHDDYLLRDNDRRIETPQYFWMRLAMGLALNEGEQATARALEFYEALSTFRFIPSESVLRNAGAVHPELIACYGATSWGDLEHITARPSKKGLTCSWIEPWHASIWDFLARPKPGEGVWEHDLNKALWVPDLFMKRVRQQGHWTLFDPSEAPGLHQAHGRAFEERYLDYEQKAARGEVTGSRQINAVDLWREILASLAQTGQPWVGFKDTANVRSPNEHRAVRSGGVCASLLLNTSPNRAAACSLGAINLGAHLTQTPAHPVNTALLQGTVHTAMRMLDNALDLAAYADDDSIRASCQEHRPVGLGLAGFQDALDQLGLKYASAAAADFADRSMELISYHAILASAALAAERGVYPNYAESNWSRGLLPIDTLPFISAERGQPLDLDLATLLDWTHAREIIQRQGLRHSTVTALAPTLAGSAITGISLSIEPSTQRLPPPQWLIECAARRQKWIDLGQSLTLYAEDDNLATLSDLYMQAWEKGLKTIRQLYCQKETAHEEISPFSGLGQSDAQQKSATPNIPPVKAELRSVGQRL